MSCPTCLQQGGHGASSSSAAPPKGEENPEDAYEWEVRDSSTPFWQHAAAGSCAGVMEHIGMYPLDTIKTRIQASTTNRGVVETARLILDKKGMRGLMRGSLVIGAGCVPAHVGLFSTYEFAKATLLTPESEQHQPVRAALCGAAATLAHDCILTPMDVVKQRLQMGGYQGALDCVLSTWRVEGITAFYRSLPTTLAMNVPYMGLLVAANESLKLILHVPQGAESDLGGAPWYFFTAGLSGAFAAALTLPLDVVKTRLQTQGIVQEGAAPTHREAPRYRGIWSTMQQIAKQEGTAGFFRGLVPRVALAMPSAAICWGTYETIRVVLRNFDGNQAHSERPGDASPPCPHGASPPESSAAPAPPAVAKRVACGRAEAGTSVAAGPATVAVSLSLGSSLVSSAQPFAQPAAPGSCAGVARRMAVHPIDAIKTPLQALLDRAGLARGL